MPKLKESGGAGGKIIASKPSKTLTRPPHQDKTCLQRTPLAAAQKELPRPISSCRPSIPHLNYPGKENPRPVSAGKPSISRSSVAGKENPRPLSARQASVVRSDNPSLKPAEKPAAAFRWSTPSLPLCKVTDFRGDGLPRVSSTGERRSFTGFRDLVSKILYETEEGFCVCLNSHPEVYDSTFTDLGNSECSKTSRESVRADGETGGR